MSVGGILMLLVALIYAYFGKKIFYTAIFLAGGTVGGMTGYTLFSKMGSMPPLWQIIGAIILFIVFGVIAILLFNIMVVIIGGIIGFAIGILIFNSLLIALLLAVIIAILSIFLFKFALGIITAIQGAMMAYWALNMLSISSNISLIIAIIIAVTGSLFQIGLFGMGGMEEKSRSNQNP